jgi:uncharacterized protein
MSIAIVCVCILGALVIGLGLNVSIARGRQEKRGGVQLPSDPADPLLKAIRAHGNASEYVPVLAILMLVASRSGPPAWVLVAAVAVTAARLVHAGALLSAPSLARQTPLRVVGATGTYLFGLALVVGAAVTI